MFPSDEREGSSWSEFPQASRAPRRHQVYHGTFPAMKRGERAPLVMVPEHKNPPEFRSFVLPRKKKGSSKKLDHLVLSLSDSDTSTKTDKSNV